MWYIACLVRGMSVDEALRQLNHIQKKGAVTVRNAILEAQQLAVEEHYVEYKSNLWVGKLNALLVFKHNTYNQGVGHFKIPTVARPNYSGYCKTEELYN